jgi:hypothetical protein
VRAVDITNDPASGLAAEALAESLRVSRDPRIKNVIWNRRMLSSYSNATRSAWQWGTFAGSNPHTHHVHISIMPDAATGSDTRPWAVGAQHGGSNTPATDDDKKGPDHGNGEYSQQPLDVNKQPLRRDSPNTGGNVGYLQAVLRNEAGEELDISGPGYGRFGPQTEQAVKNVQARAAVTADGQVDWDGPGARRVKRYRWLRTEPRTAAAGARIVPRLDTDGTTRFRTPRGMPLPSSSHP